MKHAFPLTEEFLSKLGKLRLVLRRPVVHQQEGEYLSKDKGGAFEFESHRAYVPGDEFRYIDWNLFSRSEGLFVREFKKEEKAPVYFILDRTRSMGFGTPTKWECVQKLAGALAYVGLRSLNQIKLAYAPPRKGHGELYEVTDSVELPRLLEGLFAVELEGEGTLAESLRLFSKVAQHPRFVFIFTDLLEPEESLFDGMKALVAGRHMLCLIHVLCEEEIHPALKDKVALVDSERSIVRERFVAQEELAQYSALIQEWFKEWEDFCRRLDISYVRVLNTQPLEQAVLIDFRKARILE